jgi:hypothetical protein
MSSRDSLVWTRQVRMDHRYRPHQLHLLVVVLQLATRLPGYDNKKICAPRRNLQDNCDSILGVCLRAMGLHCNPVVLWCFQTLSRVVFLDPLIRRVVIKNA